jgi:anti-sigma B factor antagonist
VEENNLRATIYAGGYQAIMKGSRGPGRMVPRGSNFVMEGHGFETNVSYLEGETVVSLCGELDVSSSTALNEELTGLIDSGATDLVIDLKLLAFIDSTGLSAILQANKKLQGIGKLVLRQPVALVRQVFEVTGLTGALLIEP